jgi:hypothetical protein
MTGSTLEERYATLLDASAVAYKEYLQRGQRGTVVSMDVRAETAPRTSALQEIANDIMSTLGPQAEIERILAKSGLWPHISPRSLLERVTISQRHLLSAPLKGKILNYGQAIAMVQRARRISGLSSQEHPDEFQREVNNDGQNGWDPLENPDWLLVELESNLLIRQVQAEIATEMLRPRSGKNSVMQLNMGEGKSSVRRRAVYTLRDVRLTPIRGHRSNRCSSTRRPFPSHSRRGPQASGPSNVPPLMPDPWRLDQSAHFLSATQPLSATWCGPGQEDT